MAEERHPDHAVARHAQPPRTAVGRRPGLHLAAGRVEAADARSQQLRPPDRLVGRDVTAVRDGRAGQLLGILCSAGQAVVFELPRAGVEAREVIGSGQRVPDLLPRVEAECVGIDAAVAVDLGMRVAIDLAGLGIEAHQFIGTGDGDPEIAVAGPLDRMRALADREDAAVERAGVQPVAFFRVHPAVGARFQVVAARAALRVDLVLADHRAQRCAGWRCGWLEVRRRRVRAERPHQAGDQPLAAACVQWRSAPVHAFQHRFPGRLVARDAPGPVADLVAVGAGAREVGMGFRVGPVEPRVPVRRRQVPREIRLRRQYEAQRRSVRRDILADLRLEPDAARGDPVASRAQLGEAEASPGIGEDSGAGPARAVVRGDHHTRQRRAAGVGYPAAQLCFRRAGGPGGRRQGGQQRDRQPGPTCCPQDTQASVHGFPHSFCDRMLTHCPPLEESTQGCLPARCA